MLNLLCSNGVLENLHNLLVDKLFLCFSVKVIVLLEELPNSALTKPFGFLPLRGAMPNSSV